MDNYKNLLEKAKKAYKNCVTGAEKRRLESIFPELKESEDEKIRKEILYVIRQLDDNTTICGRNYDFPKWIAWLEKQGGSYTKKDVDDAWLKGICDAKQEFERQSEQNQGYDQKYIADVEDEQKIKNICCYLNEFGNYLSDKNHEKSQSIYKACNWLKSFKPKQKERQMIEKACEFISEWFYTHPHTQMVCSDEFENIDKLLDRLKKAMEE